MPSRNRGAKAPEQVGLTRDNPMIDLARVPNDADDKSDADAPATDHDATGWRATPPAKP